MKILIFGLPGSGKTTLAKILSKKLKAVHINADEVREKYNDWDFTPEGRLRQAYRMKFLSDGVNLAGRTVVADFVCPTENTRLEFNADFNIWMDTITSGRFEDTNKMFEKPSDADFVVKEWNDKNQKIIYDIIQKEKLV
tara:strand:- start:10248 stop:10664 length:417 start_codon:yes stop_codon:yes gene_type:complete